MLRLLSAILLLAGPLWGAPKLEVPAAFEAPPQNVSATCAQDDVIELTAAPFDVRANDNLNYADSAAVTGLAKPVHGTAIRLANQMVQYTPGSAFTGTDTFIYSLRDETGTITIATVTIRDTQPPTFFTPVARTLALDDRGRRALPDLRDELGAADLGGISRIQQSPAPGTIREQGAHTISFEIVDRAGNSATTSTILTLADLTNPTITLPPAVFEDLVAGAPQLIPDLLRFAIAKDNDGIAQLTQNPAAGAVVAGDRVPVVVRATDLTGNFTEATCDVVFRSGDLAVPTTALDHAGNSLDLRVSGPPAINATGSIAFRGQFGAGRQGIFEFASADQPTALVLSDDAAPGTMGSFASFSNPAWNESHHVAFHASLLSGIGGVSAADDTGIWVAGAGTGRLVAREGDQAFGRARFTRFETVALLPEDRVLFVATIADDSSAFERRGIWMEVDGRPELVLLEGELPPGGGDRIRAFQFLSPIPGVSGQTRSFLHDGRLAVSHRKTREQQTISVLSPAALGFQGDCYVSTLGTLSPLGTLWQRLCEPAIAVDGTLAFRAECGANPTATLPGIFAINSLHATRAVASAGDPAPGLTGATFADFGAPVIVNEDTLSFSARLAGTAKTGSQSLWRSTATGLTLVALAGTPAPGATDYTFAAFPSFAQRANGRLLLLAELQRAGARPVRAIYAETPTGLELIVREGGELDQKGTARRVTALDFLPTLPVVAGQTRSFGASDHLVFRATLDQVRSPVIYRRKLAP